MKEWRSETLTAQVDYFFSVASPWIFLGSQRFIDMAYRTGACVFDGPTWVVDGERFWGQDRLDFLEERLQGTL